MAVTSPHRWKRRGSATLEEVIGQNHRVLNSGHHPRKFFRDMNRAIANGQVWHGEIKNRTKDGSFYWMDTTVVPTLPNSEKYLSEISGAADSLLTIINDILDVSNWKRVRWSWKLSPSRSGRSCPISTTSSPTPRAQKNIDVVFSTAQDIQPNLMGDPLRLGQILINLVNKAIKFTQPGRWPSTS
jgi:signal transduction histidine kinase